MNCNHSRWLPMIEKSLALCISVSLWAAVAAFEAKAEDMADFRPSNGPSVGKTIEHIRDLYDGQGECGIDVEPDQGRASSFNFRFSTPGPWDIRFNYDWRYRSKVNDEHNKDGRFWIEFNPADIDYTKSKLTRVKNERDRVTLYLFCTDQLQCVLTSEGKRSDAKVHLCGPGNARGVHRALKHLSQFYPKSLTEAD